MAQTSCPKCGSTNITFQREQTGNIGAGTNRVVIESGKGHGCLYWVIIGWWWKPLYFILIGWWWNLFFGAKKSGLNVHAGKTLNQTVGICQDCGNTWKVK